MIIANGTIEPKSKGAGGIDPTTGYPTAGESSWGDPVPCQYVPVQQNLQGEVGGEHYTLASYTILLEEQDWTAEQLRLSDRSGTVIGEYSVKAVEPLDAVCEIRLTV